MIASRPASNSVATIYALRDPRTDAIRYVGRTSRKLSTRVSGHLAAARMTVHRCAKPMGAWLRGLLADGVGPRVEVLEVVPDRLCEAAEVLWIAQLRQMRVDLLNQARGGWTNAGVRRSPQQRRRVGQWSRRQWAERRDEIIAAQNAGKDDVFRAKHRQLGRQRCADGTLLKKMTAGRNTPTARVNMTMAAAKKLTPAKLKTIRRLLGRGDSQQSIANRFGVHQSAISRIKHGKRWMHIRTS